MLLEANCEQLNNLCVPAKSAIKYFIKKLYFSNILVIVGYQKSVIWGNDVICTVHWCFILSRNVYLV